MDHFDKKDKLMRKMKFALVETVVAQDNPTVETLHKTVLEEFGERASKELENHFLKKLSEKQARHDKLAKSVGESALDLVRSVVNSENPSLEKLQDEFKKKRGEEVSPVLESFFRAQMRKKAVVTAGVRVPTGQSKVALLRQVVADKDPSREKLDEAFFKEFGIKTPPELLAVFDLEMLKLEASQKGLTLPQLLVQRAKSQTKSS
ncbi:MAG: hypothetical protein QMD09_02920 [Desulfatibacillaceae bacterium]|nr:hypothetical protein [Desulfatibacillaceae bacterium]